MSISVFNRRWAALILEALVRHGVHHVCIAPGSRSTPLTLAAAENEALCCHTHFDERGLGHLALGLAKASLSPVAVIVTSGTAVANLYPALIEAGLTGERLVFLTADRPPELIDCGANQAIRQSGIFSSHPHVTLSLPRPTPDISARWLVSALDDAMAQLTHSALHVNCPFAEPLYGDDDGSYQAWSDALGAWWHTNQPWLDYSQHYQPLPQPDWAEWRLRKGVIIAGRISAAEGVQLAKWADCLGWPLISDVQAPTGQPLPYADLWLANPQAQQILAQAELVIQFGGGLTGKRLLQWQQQCQPMEFWLVDAQPGRLDPACHTGRRICLTPLAWLALHPASLNSDPDASPSPVSGWADGLQTYVRQAHHSIKQHIQTWGEAELAHRLPALLAPNGQLFLGNSLIVRLIDALAQLPAGYPIFANRGASGIDGLLSTAAGVFRAQACPTLAVLGDLSALYDINSLALMRQTTKPLIVIVVNNNGGQIFSLLPTPPAERERFYCMPQHVSFEHAAALFDLAYAAPTSWDELQQVVTQGWQQQGTLIIELKVTPEMGAKTLRDLVQQQVKG